MFTTFHTTYFWMSDLTVMYLSFHFLSFSSIKVLNVCFSLSIWWTQKILNASNAMVLVIFIWKRQVNVKTPQVNLLTRGKNRPVGWVISMTDSSLFMTWPVPIPVHNRTKQFLQRTHSPAALELLVMNDMTCIIYGIVRFNSQGITSIPWELKHNINATYASG